MSLYLDASVVVPTLVNEGASAAVDHFFEGVDQPLLLSDMAAVEVASALARLARMVVVTREMATILLGEFDDWRASATAALDFERVDFLTADMFIRRFELGLRAPDALHAAACQRGDHTLVTLDRRLARAARTLGVKVTCLG